MPKITLEEAAAALQYALDFEMPDATRITDDIFDKLVQQLRRNPRFKHMSITEVDLVLAASKREFECELDQAFSSVERRLVQSFEDELSDKFGAAA
jgi:hypothetical protein